MEQNFFSFYGPAHQYPYYVSNFYPLDMTTIHSNAYLMPALNSTLRTPLSDYRAPTP